MILTKSLSPLSYTGETKKQIKSILDDDYVRRKDLVTLKVGEDEYEVTLGRVFLNILLMRVFAETGVAPTKDDLFPNKSVTQDALEKYFNHLITRFRNEKLDVDYDRIRQIICDTEDEMCDRSSEYNPKVGYSISYTDFIKLGCTDKEAYDLFHPTVKPGAYSDIEAQFNAEGKKEIAYFEKNKDCELHPFVVSETGVNKKQLTQMIGFVGLKPDMDGSVIPVTISDNFLIGLKGLESYFINAKGTRKALTTNNRMTRKSGYLTRKLSLSNIDHYHDNNIKDCGTKHFVNFYVDNERKLRQIVGRHYYNLNEKGEKVSDELHTVRLDSHELVGKHIGLRSPVTCCGKHVCATCYGRELSEINKDINTGLAATLKLTEPLTQRLLSAKHLLSTKTDKVEWGEGFSEVFTVNMDSIYFIPDTECTISFNKPTQEEFDEDENMYYITEIRILLAGNKKATLYNSPTNLYINPKLLPAEKMKDDDTEISISSKAFGDDDFVFKYQAKNNELTQSLQEILDLIENTDHLGITDYNEFINKFDDLLIENDLDYINSVHIEMISSVLFRDAKTGKRVDWSKDKIDDYEIYRVSKSIMEGPLGVSLAFERLNDQLIDLNTYEKEDVSMMDNLYL